MADFLKQFFMFGIYRSTQQIPIAKVLKLWQCLEILFYVFNYFVTIICFVSVVFPSTIKA